VRAQGPTSRSRRRRRAARLVTQALPGAVLLGLLALTWQLVAVHNAYLVPRIGAIWDQLVDYPREFLDAAGNTLQESAVGLGASFAVAFSLAIAMSHIRVVERAVMPVAVIINVTPVVSLAPGLAVALGFGMSPRYLVTGIIVFFPMLINSLIGLRSVDPEALQYFASLDASKLEVLLHLRIPSSLPFLFAAARICFPLSIIGAVFHCGHFERAWLAHRTGVSRGDVEGPAPGLCRDLLPGAARAGLHPRCHGCGASVAFLAPGPGNAAPGIGQDAAWPVGAPSVERLAFKTTGTQRA
jgi:NitT/TauT family transport system permease protein